jgi:type IV fimbrial biogenesis protein FimT
MRARRQRGFTMLELMLILVVLAVLSSLALPSLGARLERQRVQGAAEGLAADLSEARFEAARRGQALYVETTAGPDWCWAVATAPGCACGQARDCQMHRVQATDHRGTRLVQGMVVQMGPTGTAQGPQMALLETSRGERLRVEVSTLGRPRVCAESGTWPRVAPC